MKTKMSILSLVVLTSSYVTIASAVPIYLNQENMSVEVGLGTSPGSFNNTFNGGSSINKVIDAPSADTEEFHSQTSHVWFTAEETGGGLELLFKFDQQYDISTLHFWNYTSENFDVDGIDFSFFDGLGDQVGMLSVSPALGSSPGIRAEDIPLSAPLNVQSVTTFLSGSNGQVDFQNIGFSADQSVLQPPSVPPESPGTPTVVSEPLTLLLFSSGLIGMVLARRR